MKQFNIYVPNGVGAIAKVTQLLNRGPVNLESISTEIREKEGVIHVTTNDENTTRSLLNNANMMFDEDEILVIQVGHQPGELAKQSIKLADNGVNITSMHLLEKKNGYARIGVSVDDPRKARQVLRKAITN